MWYYELRESSRSEKSPISPEFVTFFCQSVERTDGVSCLHDPKAAAWLLCRSFDRFLGDLDFLTKPRAKLIAHNPVFDRIILFIILEKILLRKTVFRGFLFSKFLEVFVGRLDAF